MGLLRWLGLGKKQEPAAAPAPVEVQTTHEPPAHGRELEVVVYGTNEAARCVNVRELLTRNGFAFRDVRMDDNLSARAWLQRATGDDGLPKVFVAARCYGGYEDVAAMISSGAFQQAVEGRLIHREDDELAALKEELSVDAIVTLLRKGEILTIDEGGSETDVWAEPYAKPPVVYYEGAPTPLEEIAGIAGKIMERVEAGEIEARWKEED